ncbi:hypothetical protein DFH11DRAFT_153528 [Phellopilus nigrolimitatus]|nr:hypothetical protein DFH11DRAFT_153528 [Phellopilus nigrolimitatus]
MADLLNSALIAAFKTSQDVLAIADSILNWKASEVESGPQIASDTIEQYTRDLAALREEIMKTADRLDILLRIGHVFTSFQEQEAVYNGIVRLNDETLTARGLFMGEEKSIGPLLARHFPSSNPAEENSRSLFTKDETHLSSLAATLLHQAPQELAQSRMRIREQSTYIFSVYEDHLRVRLELILNKSASDSLGPAHIDIISNFLEFTFRKNPFNVSIGHGEFEDVAPILALMNSHCSIKSHCADVYRELGRSWITDFKHNCSHGTKRDWLSDERYVLLLKHMSHFLDAELTSLPLPIADACARPPQMTSSVSQPSCRDEKGNYGQSDVDLEITAAEVTGQRRDLMQDIGMLVRKEIEREKTRGFSVALCGMVKSGYACDF